MFLTPAEMAKEYMQQLTRKQETDMYIESQMEDYKAEAVKRLYRVIDPLYAEAMAATIACSYENELPQALEIVKKLALNDKHIAALNDDFKLMTQLILEDWEDRKYYETYGD